MTLSFSQLGKLGRLGNMMFQVAATIGIALKYGLEPVFPQWELDRYLQNPIPHGQMNVSRVYEQGFRHQDIKVKGGDDLFGYLQSKKYWEEHEAEVLKQFEFRKDFEGYFKTRSLYARVFEKEVVAVHIRRGDYVGNENYYSLEPEYYIQAIRKYFSDKNKYNIFVFSDDTKYAIEVLPPSDNITHAIGNSDIDDLCMMTQSNHWIIANSSFSWWGAYLGSKKNGGTVIRPVNHFDGPLKKTHDISDLYPEEWIAFEPVKEKEKTVAEIAKAMDENAKKLYDLVGKSNEVGNSPTISDGSVTSSNEVNADRAGEASVGSTPTTPSVEEENEKAKEGQSNEATAFVAPEHPADPVKDKPKVVIEKKSAPKKAAKKAAPKKK